MANIKAVIKVRQKVEEFKGDHKSITNAISRVIDDLQFPANTLFGIFWESIEAEDKSAGKVRQLLERFERIGDTNEKLLTEIQNKISEILERGAPKQEIQQKLPQPFNRSTIHAERIYHYSC